MQIKFVQNKVVEITTKGNYSWRIHEMPDGTIAVALNIWTESSKRYPITVKQESNIVILGKQKD